MDPEGGIIPIHDPDDPRIDAFRDVKDRDLTGRRHAFMAESEMVIRRLMDDSPYHVQALLLNPRRAESMRDVIERRSPETAVYVAEQSIFDQIAGFHIHRGALALGARPPAQSIDDVFSGLREMRTVLVLENLTNHDNVGGVFRCAAAFSVNAVVLTERCADPFYRKATRVSMGATLTVPVATVSHAGEAIAALKSRGFSTLALTPSPDAREITELRGDPSLARVALLLGEEGPGLDPRTQRDADWRIRLGSMVGADSLNVVVAAGIALYALSIRGR